MTLTDRCVCMVETCWRKGICEFCINNHGGNRDTVSCALSAEAYAGRKQHWDLNHDEPPFPTNTRLGQLSKEAMELTKEAILSLRDVQQAASRCSLESWRLSKEFDPAAARRTLLSLEQLYADLNAVIDRTEAAVRMGKAAKTEVPDTYC